MSCDIMGFPETFEEYAKRYSIKDTEEHYTNGSELIPVFRVNQWLEHSAYKLSKKTMPEVIDTLLESIKKEFSPVVGEYMTQEIWEIIDKHKIGGVNHENLS